MTKTPVKALIKELVPPLLADFIKKIKSSSSSFASYEDAMKKADGYEDDVLTKVVVAKGKKFSEQFSKTKELDLKTNGLDLMSLRTFVGLASSLDKNRLTVIDFGGAAGTHYVIAKSILSENIELDWRVIETSAMVAEAKKQDLENNELRFFDSIDLATAETEVDLVFACGSVHCTPQPYDFLTTLASIDAKVLMITRTPVTDVPCVILQRSTLSANGVGDIPEELKVKDKVLSYPATMMDRKRVEEILAIFGKVHLRLAENKAAYISDKGSYDMFGYVVKK